MDVIVVFAGRCGYPAAGCGKGIRWGLGFWGCDSYHRHSFWRISSDQHKKNMTSIATPKKIKKSQLIQLSPFYSILGSDFASLSFLGAESPAVHVWGLFGSWIPPGVERKILQRPGAGGAGGITKLSFPFGLGNSEGESAFLIFLDKLWDASISQQPSRAGIVQRYIDRPSGVPSSSRISRLQRLRTGLSWTFLGGISWTDDGQMIDALRPYGHIVRPYYGHFATEVVDQWLQVRSTTICCCTLDWS